MKTQRFGASMPVSNHPQPFAVSPAAAPPMPWRNVTGLLSRAWAWIQEKQAARSSARRLQVTSTVSLGEKRFVAVVQVDEMQFLVGGGASSVSLLAQLDKKEPIDNESFGEVLRETGTAPAKKPVLRASKGIEEPRGRRARAGAWSTL